MEAMYHSQAFNFTSAVTGHVDPRTGIFGVNIPIVHIIGNDHMGPELPLTLSYSPLDNNDATYGLGFSDNLTRYNKESKILTLSTGQSYHVKEEKSECTFSHAEPKNFKFLKKNNELWVVYNTGASEKLTTYETADNIKVVREIYSPAGNKLTLNWEDFAGYPRLKSISDQSNILLSVSYSSAGERISFDIWPNSDESYCIHLVQQGIFLATVTIDTQQQLLTWSLSYSKYGRSNRRHKFLTKITTPTGLVEQVEYKRNGHRLPENNPIDQSGAHNPVIIYDQLPYLPYVKKHILEPGYGVPKQITSYEYSVKNFLGYGGQINGLTLNGQDYLYNVENDYQYYSIEMEENWAENETYYTIRNYNSFHLMIEEKELTVSNNRGILCEKINQIKYYADVTKSFAQQVPQYQMPKEHTVIWKEDGNFRVEKSLSEYDEYCNITLQQDFDETKTIFTYYNANGEAGACPAEPHGFKRFVKEQTLYPPISDFQTPIRKTQYKYDSYPVKNSYSTVTDKMVLLRAEQYFSDNAQIKRQEMQYYNDITSANHGRVSEKKVWVSENGHETASYKEEYQWSILNNSQIRCITKLTGLKDNLSVSKEQCWTLRAYRLIMEKDIQNNITQYSYNKLGQIISNTLNLNTEYENRMEYSWSFKQSGIPISVIMTDTTGNKYRINMDGQGRLVEKYYFTQQVPNGFKIESRQYNLFGQLNRTTHYDLLNPGEASQDIRETSISYKYNHWRENVRQEHSNGTSISDIYEPIRNQSRQQIVSLIDASNTSSIIQKEYNTRGQLVKLVQLKADAITQYTVWQFFIDGLGRIRKTIDESNNTTLFEYDEFDRVNKQVLADGTTIKKQYKDGLPVQISLTAQNGTEKILGTQQFDSLGRLTNSQTGGRNTRLHYQGASPAPYQVTNPDGSVINYQYISALNNAIAEIRFGEITRTLEYETVTGRLNKISENNGMSHTFIYNDAGQLNQERIVLPNQRQRTNYYNYSLANRLISYSGADNETTVYSYDANGKLNSIIDRGIRVNLNYDKLGRYIGQLAHYEVGGNSVETKLSLDEFGREFKREVIENNKTKITTFEIEQDIPANNKISNKKLYLNKRLLREENYSYDLFGRLTDYQCFGDIQPETPEGKKIQQQNYHWDAFGNLIRSVTTADNTNETVEYKYLNSSDPCQLTNIEYLDRQQSVSLQYDANGRMTVDEVRRSLNYDVMGRLKTVTKNQNTTFYGYDGLNRLLMKQSNDDFREFYYLSDILTNEFYSDGQIRYNTLDKTCLGFRQEFHDKNKPVQSTATATDTMGSVFALFDNGQETTIKSYSPWGDGAGQGSVGPRFNGEHLDEASGSYLLGNGYRAYSSQLMRFTAPDNWSPFGEGGINAYAYCNGDPINLSDPNGHISGWGWASIIVGGIGLLLAPLTFGLSLKFGVGVALALTALEAASGATAIISGALEEKNPQASEQYGWASLGLGAPSAVMGIFSLGKGAAKGISALKSAPIKLGGKMREVDLLIDGLYTFEDTYKKGVRFNIVAHGEPVGNGSQLVIKTAGGKRNMDVDELVSILKSERYNFDNYSNIRTLSCYSGVGEDNSFGYRLGQQMKKDVKSYIGPVTGNFTPEGVSDIFKEAERIQSYDAMQQIYKEKFSFKVYKKNPYNFFKKPDDYWSWKYKPIKFKY